MVPIVSCSRRIDRKTTAPASRWSPSSLSLRGPARPSRRPAGRRPDTATGTSTTPAAATRPPAATRMRTGSTRFPNRQSANRRRGRSRDSSPTAALLRDRARAHGYSVKWNSDSGDLEYGFQRSGTCSSERSDDAPSVPSHIVATDRACARRRAGQLETPMRAAAAAVMVFPVRLRTAPLARDPLGLRRRRTARAVSAGLRSRRGG